MTVHSLLPTPIAVAEAPIRGPLLLSVVVPTYNESENLSEFIARCEVVLGGIAFEIVFVDDDSPDGTHRLAKSIAQFNPRVRCLRRVGRRGLAGAVIDGILSCSSPIVAVMDCDLQHDESLLPRMLDEITGGRADLVIGSRLVEGGSATAGFGSLRARISTLGARLAGLALGTRVTDPMSGFFMVRRDAFEEKAAGLGTDGFKILADFLATGGRDLRVAELGYHFRPRHAGDSKFDISTGLEYIGLLAHRASRGLLPSAFPAFAIVGTVGLAVHLSVLMSVRALAPTFIAAQTMATLCAMVVNYVLNNELTFRRVRRRGPVAFLIGLALFCGACSIGALANVGASAWLFEREGGWIVSALAGVIVGTMWNFGASQRLVWR